MESPAKNRPTSNETPPANSTKLFQLPTVAALLVVILVGVLQVTRNAAVANPVLAAGQYRVDMRVILDRDDVKVIQYRVESISPFYATVTHDQGLTSSESNRDSKAKVHFTEVTVLLDHIDSRKCVKELLRVGAVGGRSVESVPDDYSLNENTRIKNADGAFRRNQSVELLQWNGRTYTLSLEQ